MIATNTLHSLPAATVVTIPAKRGNSPSGLAIISIILAMILVGLWGAASLISGIISAGGPLGLIDGFVHALAGI